MQQSTVEVRANRYFYLAEGTLPPHMDCYIERAADAALLKALRDRKFAFMLASRKVGKSSLMEHAFVQLRREGIFVAKKELTEAGGSVGEEGWYAGLIQELVNDAALRNQFRVQAGWREWWREQSQLPPGPRFIDFIRRFFLEPSEAAWIIAIDEIDTTIALSFSDDFFAAVRMCQNKRASDPLFARLTFLLAGVASPAQLIKDNRRTPFNIGQPVSLTDFTAREARVLLRGLGLPEDERHPLLQRVLYWTGGHPYLTQRVFLQLAETFEQIATAGEDWQRHVDDAVGVSLLHASARTTEAHFQDIGHRRIGNLDDHTKRRALAIYARALQHKPVADDALAVPVVELKLCGLLVANHPGNLVVRNRIYERVFDAAWVRQTMPRDRWKMVSLAALLAGCFVSVASMWYTRQLLIDDLSAQIARANADVPGEAWQQLRSRSGQAQHADQLMGQYWARQARLAAVSRPRDEAALLWLKALALDPTPEARWQTRNAFAGSLPQVQATLRHHGAVSDVAFSPDGTRVLTASRDNSAQLWQADTGQAMGQSMLHKARVLQAAFSPSGSRVITASFDNTAQLWDGMSGLPLGKPMLHQSWVMHAALRRDEHQAVSAGADKTARLWDLQSGAALFKPLRHLGWVRYAEFSPDGQRLLTASDDNTAQLWNGSNGKPLGQAMRHKDWVTRAVFSPDGRRVLTTSLDSTARLWDGTNGKALGPVMRHDGGVRFGSFSGDGLQIVTASDDASARLWDGASGQPLAQAMWQQNPVLHASFSPDRHWLLTASSDNSARLWESASGAAIGIALQHQDAVVRTAISPDGHTLATASNDGTARLWSVASVQAPGKRLPLQFAVHFVSFSADGHTVLAVGRDHVVRLRDFASGVQLGAPLAHAQRVWSAVLSPDGRRVLTASADHQARVWDATLARPLLLTLAHADEVTHAAFSPDGTRIVTTSRDKTARLWDAASGKPLGTDMQHLGEIRFAAFSADGMRVVTASDDNTARIWDAHSGQAISLPLVHNGPVWRAAFSPDGHYLLTGSDEKTVPAGELTNGQLRLWDAATGALLGESVTHLGHIEYVGFSSDGQHVISRTAQTLNWFAISHGAMLVPQKTAWANAGQWSSDPMPVAPDASLVRIADGASGNSVLVRDLMRAPGGEPGVPDIPGQPAQLLQQYLRRFALRFENVEKTPRLLQVYPESAGAAAANKTPLKE